MESRAERFSYLLNTEADNHTFRNNSQNVESVFTLSLRDCSPNRSIPFKHIPFKLGSIFEPKLACLLARDWFPSIDLF